MLENLALGASVALSPENLLYAFVGCLLGTLIGILPGLGPLATISMLLPFTFGLDPTSALIMLAGIYYGAAYGGSTTAILVNLPGETSSAVTVIDGYKMALNGTAGVAIFTAGVASFIAGCIGTLLVAAFAVPLSALAYEFGAPEYFSLMVLGLIGAVALTHGSLAKAIAMIALGVLAGLIGIDMNSGVQRFTFGLPQLWDGVDFVVLAVGLFAVTEIISSLETPDDERNDIHQMGRSLPTKAEMKRLIPSSLRGTAIGSIMGILPGAGLTLATFFAYGFERKVARHRAEMGKGAIEGVAAPEAANNAAAQTAFIPTLSLGLPGSPTMALMLGAMIMFDIQPGPNVINSKPDLFWGLVVSMWIGNLMLIILNLPLVGLWVKLLKVPYEILFPAILMFCAIGAYSSQLASFDLVLCVVFGLSGYVLRKLDCEPAPFVLGFVLGPMLEENFRRAMVLADGNATVFLHQPISAGFLAAAALLIVLPFIGSVSKRFSQRRMNSVG